MAMVASGFFVRNAWQSQGTIMSKHMYSVAQVSCGARVCQLLTDRTQPSPQAAKRRDTSSQLTTFQNAFK